LLNEVHDATAFGRVAVSLEVHSQKGSTMTATIKKLTLSEYQALQTSIPKFLPNFGFLIASQTLTTAQIMTMINVVVNSATVVANAVSAVKTARIADAAVQSQYAETIRELREIIGVAFSNVPATLTQFAIAPKKVRAPLTAAAKVAANAKAAATRIARGTESKKKKAAISGGVTGVTITANTTATPATTPNPTAPAPAATVLSQMPGGVPVVASAIPVAPAAPTGTAPHS
jgi:hypothetical protein